MKVKDVLIVGGSISGSMAGFLLGKSGKDVAIIEPSDFPRYKACGEGLSKFGYDILTKYGLWNKVLEDNAVPFYGYNLNLKSGANFDLSYNKSEGYGIQRYILDYEVQKRAKEYSEIIPEFATNISRKQGIWQVETCNGMYSSKELILAWGGVPKLKDKSNLKIISKNNSLIERYGLALWVKGSWVRPSNQMINVFQEEDLQILTTPVANDILNISIMVNKANEVLKNELVERAYHVAERIGFEISEIITSKGASAIHSSTSCYDIPGAYKVGDALERFDPIGGMGMTNALSSAVLVSKIINAQFDLSIEASRAQKSYFDAYSNLAWYYRNLTRLSFETLVNINPFLVKVAESFPAIRSNLFRVGKYLTHKKIGALC
jgi:flavin-dependent dehydrogenase